MKYEDAFLVMKMMMTDDNDDICNWPQTISNKHKPSQVLSQGTGTTPHPLPGVLTKATPYPWGTDVFTHLLPGVLKYFHTFSRGN